MERKRREIEIISKYDKLLHHLHLEYPELSEISSKTLETFDITKRKKSSVFRVVQDKISKVKRKEKLTTLPSTGSTIVEFKNILFSSAQKCPSANISRFQIRDIKNLIEVPHLQEKYTDILEEMFNEIKEEYLSVTHASRLHQTIKIPIEIPNYFEIKPFRYVGKTERYNVYLRIRKEFKSKWMLHQPLLRAIIEEFSILPDVFFSIARKGEKKIDFEDLEYEMQKNLLEARKNILDFYGNIEMMVENDKANIHVTLMENYLGSCTCAMAIRLSEIIGNTLKHIVETTRSDRMPLLNLHVTFNSKMEVFPTSQQLSELFQCLIKDTIALIEPIRALHRLEKVYFQHYQKPINLYLTNEFINGLSKEVETNIEVIYSPVVKYLKTLNNQFEKIYYDIDNIACVSDLKVEVGCAKINYYNSYFSRVSLIPEYELFDMGIVILSEYIQRLQKGLTFVQKNLFNALASQNLWEMKDIRESFQIIRTRAEIDPITTEQTIEIGKYMTWVKADFLQEATERISEGVIRLATLLEIGILEDDHIDLNISVVKELEEVEPIVDENLTVFEQLKFEAEEKLQKQIESINELTREVHPILCLLDDMDDVLNIRQYLCKINVHLLKIKYIETQIAWINDEEVALSFPKSTYPEFEELKNYVYPFFHLMKLSLDVQRNVSVWLDGQFDLQSYDETKVKLEGYQKELAEMQKNYRKKLRQAQDDNLRMRFRGTVDDPDILNWPAPLKICTKTIKLLADFEPCISLMKIVCNPSLRIRHWKEMSAIANIDLLPSAGSTLRKLMTYDLKPHLQPLEIISQGASHEQELLEIINEMRNKWLQIKLDASMYAKTDWVVFTNLKPVISLCEEDLEKLLIISRSSFVRPHKDDVEQFQKSLVNLKRILSHYEALQEKFFHLLPLFTFMKNNNERSVPLNEFEKVKHFKKEIYVELKKDAIFNILQNENILNGIQQHCELFESIYHSIGIYLNLVREKFARFYFLSNEEMIEMLSNALSDEAVLQYFFSKCFRCIQVLKIKDGMIIGMTSSNGENIAFSYNIPVRKNLVETFREVEKDIFNQMTVQVANTSKENFKNKNVILSQLCQVAYIAFQVFCTTIAHQAVDGNEQSLWELEWLFQEYITLIRNKQLSNIEKLSLKNIVISLIHHKEYIKEIISKNINDKDFTWLSRMKYYLQNDECLVRTLNLSLAYGYEYFGSFSCTVSTFHTERAIICILNAYNLNFNCAVHGQATVGKTEIFSSLAIALGVNFINIACSDVLSYQILERFLIGSSKATAWICLDDVDKLTPSSLSMMSDLLDDILYSKILTQSDKIKCFVGMTLNSVFTKRTDLPIILRKRLRNIGMIPIDVARFSEVSLTSIGYKSAKEISSCISCMFNFLPSVLLESSYDFSIQKLKNILHNCDKILERPLNEERSIVVEAIQKNIQPMLTESDTVTFRDLLRNIFGYLSEDVPYNGSEYRAEIISSIESHHLHPYQSYVGRILQTLDAINAKKNVILLGNICSGKSNAVRMLYNFMNGGNDGLHILNPVTFDMRELYGFMDTKYNTWCDGIITRILRKFSGGVVGNWLVFDGPIEPNWIEALYSILDDRRVIVLDSGELLNIEKSNSVLFEVTELTHVSPTIVSRCTIIYYETSTKPWITIVEPWIIKNYSFWPESIQHLLRELFYWLASPLLKFLHESCVQECSLGNFHLVKMTVNYVEILLNEALAKKDEDIKNITIWLQASVFQGIYNGFVATLDHNSLLQFDVFFKQLCKNQNAEYPLPDTIEKIDVNIPTDGLFSEYVYIYKGRGTFKYIPDTLKNEKLIHELHVNDILVPTTDTMRNLSILDMHVSHNFHTLFVGPTGGGKTLCVKHYLRHKVNKSKLSSIFLKFIPRLTSKKLQSFIKSSFTKNISFRETKSSKRNLIVIEDLNVVSLDQFNVSYVIELLRHVLDHKFWYDGNDFEKILVENVGFIASMGSKGGFNKSICPRLLKYFNIFKTKNICEDNIQRIFSNVLLVVWKQNGFASDIALIANSVVSAFLSVYEFCLKNFKSSPLKFSYSYNIWDFCKALRGLFLLKKESADVNKKIYYKLWMHESLRVFGDRLSDVNEKNILHKEIITIYENAFKESFEEAFNDVKAENLDEKLTFGFLTNTKYEEIDYSNILEAMKEILKKYNKTNNVKIVLFEEFLMQIVKVSRLLCIENSNGLIMGASGTGRKTLIELASIMHNCLICNPHIFYEYDTKKWHGTFKKILLDTGGTGKSGVLYLNEEHLKYQFILEDINFFMKNGDLIDLFEIEEEPEVLNLVRLDAQYGNPNLNISSESVYSFFVNRCRTKLHIILSLNCESIILERRINSFQSFMKFCTPIWFYKWSNDALKDIAKDWIKDSEFSSEIKTVVPEIFASFFNEGKLLTESVFQSLGEKYNITTASYIEFLILYVDIMDQEQQQLEKRKEKYLTGLRKLKYADNQIRQLQESLAAYQLQLKIMTKKAAQMTRQIAKETLEVERASDLVKRDEKVANKQADAAAVLKLDCEADLAQAIPILEDAIQALNTLKPSDITLVKSMKNPPDAIKLVMAAVCVIKDVKPDRIPDPSTGRKLIDYWGPSKRILGDMNFLQTLKDFDKDHIKAEIMVKIRKDYLPHKDFKPHVVAKASSAAEGLCKWIIAMDMYDNVAKEVAPKKDKLEKSEKEYAQTIAILDEKKAEVARLEKQLAKLSAKLQEANKRQHRVQKAADACNRKLDRSLVLISGFENEKTTWSREVTDLEHKHECLAGDVLLTSATISYLSAVPVNYRNEILEKWHRCLMNYNLTRSDDWGLDKNLTSTENVNFRGLPKEYYFVENCIIFNYSYKWPLFIDPHGMAKHWIKKNVDDHLLHVIKYGRPNLVEDIEFCLRLGKTLLIENIDEKFSSAFNSLLNKDLTEKNGEYFILFEGKQIKYDKNFKLYMTTPLRSPNYRSQISNKLKIINFTLTKTSLQKKLLNIVIKTENSLVSRQMSIYKKNKLTKEKLLKKYEDNILKILSDAEDDLLEDHKALRILDETKKLSEETAKDIYIAEKFVSTFEQLKSNFEDFSHHASVLFFCIEDFWRMKGVAKFSSQWFMGAYRKAILDAPLSGYAAKRVQNVTSFLNYAISRLVLRMLFEKDALTFLFHLSFNISIFRKEIDSNEVEFFYKRETFALESISKKMLERFLDSDDARYSETFDPDVYDTCEYSLKLIQVSKNFQALQQLEAFKDLGASVKKHSKSWESFLDLENPERHEIPDNWTNKLNSFQKFLLIQTLRVDRTNECIKTFVSHVLGEEYIRPKDVDLEELFSESFCLSPILFLTTNDNSPLTKIKNFAVRKKFSNKFRTICLSDGDNLIVENLIREGQKEGLWICLVNCHLSASWLLQLEGICEAMTYENTSENFRLWMISDVLFKFPEEMVEKCVKIIYEHPESLSENILSSYKNFVDDVNVREYQKYSPKVTRFIYRTICFHTVILRRQKFEGASWSFPYNFTNYDLEFATKSIPYIMNTFGSDEALKYLIGECSYSGQFLNEVDYKVSSILFKEFLRSDSLPCFSFPSKNDIHDFIDHITKLPKEESAQMVCFNDIVVMRKNIEDSTSLSSYIVSNGAICDTHFENQKVLEVVEKILQTLDIEIEYKNIEHNDALNIVLLREIESHLRLAKHIKNYLAELRVLLVNNLLLFPDIQDVVADLWANKIPKIFFKYSFLTDQNFSSFIWNLKERLLFFRDWKENGPPNSFWISSFFYPNSFLAFQNTIYAQKIDVPLQNISNFYEIKDSTNGIKIYGLYMINAKYEKSENCIELLPKKIYFYNMPCVSITPVVEEKDNCFVCPVYRTNTRTDCGKFQKILKNFVCTLYLRSNVDESTLAKLGVAMTCECPKEVQ